jgi:hypothetical protein
VQNWQSSNINGRNNAGNAWRLANLALAVKSARQDKVILVQGGILNIYSKSSSLTARGGNGVAANGALAYGTALTWDFVYDDGGANGDAPVFLAQRFEKGLIVSNAASGDGFFLPETPPSQIFLPDEQVGLFEGEALFAGETAPHELKMLFSSAHAAACDIYAQKIVPDGNVIHRQIQDAPIIVPYDNRGGEAQVTELYFQFYNNYSYIGVLAKSDALHFDAVIIPPTFAGAFLSADTLGTEPSSAAAAQLLQALRYYGIPLSTELPYDSAGKIVRAMRFSNGFLVNSQ